MTIADPWSAKDAGAGNNQVRPTHIRPKHAKHLEFPFLGVKQTSIVCS
jgi:hypothetical protein